jgi:hypothetical protein
MSFRQMPLECVRKISAMAGMLHTPYNRQFRPQKQSQPQIQESWTRFQVSWYYNLFLLPFVLMQLFEYVILCVNVSTSFIEICVNQIDVVTSWCDAKQ